MQEPSHHGQVIREYREKRAGITQEELARRIGKSRRTVVSLEQTARISDLKVRRTLALALQIPPALLGLSDIIVPEAVVLTPVESTTEGRNLSRMVLETFTENLRMRLDLYYLSAVSADKNLNAQIQALTQLLQKSSQRDRDTLLKLLSHNYQIKGMIARDQLDFKTAEQCFKQASLLAQEAGCAELNALTLSRQAVMYCWQERFEESAQLYEAAREIAKRGSPALRAHMATGYAEVQARLGDQRCLVSLTEARSLLRRVDLEDDPLLLLHSTRASERAINDGWSQCHTFLGKPEIALESYEKSEQLLEPSLARMRARLYIQQAEALYVSKDMSCCFYAEEGLKLARAVGSQYNIWRVKQLATKLGSQFPADERVKGLLKAVSSLLSLPQPIH
jgi:DNA-binding XRE family transcriptional regulator